MSSKHIAYATGGMGADMVHALRSDISLNGGLHMG